MSHPHEQIVDKESQDEHRTVLMNAPAADDSLHIELKVN